MLLVTDAGVHGLGLTQPLEHELAEHHIACTVYDKTVANPLSPVPVLMNAKEPERFYTILKGLQP